MAAALRAAVVHSTRLSARISGLSSTSRLLSTSGKKEDTPVAAEPPPPLSGYPKRFGLYEEGSGPAKPARRDWITYGFSLNNEVDDLYGLKMAGFFGITVLFVLGTFMLAYMPDIRAIDWTKREAYLELHRRESLGLPLVGKDLVDPSRISLPSEEEIGDTEIII